MRSIVHRDDDLWGPALPMIRANPKLQFLQHNNARPNSSVQNRLLDTAHNSNTAVPLSSTRLGTYRVRLGRGRKEGHVLFNNTLNTFYVCLYGVGHMVKNHSDSERGNPLPPLHELLFPSSFLPSHRQDITYQGLCYSSRGALAGMRNNSMGPP